MEVINGKSLIFFVIFALVAVMAFNVLKRNRLLTSSKKGTVVEIMELKFRKKGTTTRTTDAYYRFSLSTGEIINGKTEINNPTVEVGSCYKASYAATNPAVINIYFAEVVPCANTKSTSH
jgi:hypothetical protein